MYKMNQKLFLVILALLAPLSVIFAQKAALKTNLIYWGTTSPNIEAEFGLGKQTTLEIGGGFNLFEYSENKKFKHWLVQPEFRYWFCERFNGHFLGIHAHGAQFNVGNWDIPIGRLENIKNRRYEGLLYGAGLSWGYQWVLSPHWNFEFNLGGGYARIDYREFCGRECGSPLSSDIYNYLGITRAGLSLVYFIK